MIIREIKKEEYGLLDDFLYEAIYIPKGVNKPPRDITKVEELQVYIRDFGKKDDYCFVAVSNKIVGAVWTRIMNDFGHIDNETPSLAISLYEEYRGKGIGTKLMEEILKVLKEKGYKAVSLAVWKENYAVNLYKKVGFEIIAENESEFIMKKVLDSPLKG